MSELAQPLPFERPAARGVARPLALRLSLTWETAAYAALFAAAFGFRFWDLGARALHHDESLHGYYSWVLYTSGSYAHNPLMHGPFQFFGTALVFFLAGGASDYTVRILPALFGTALVALPLLFRGHLGRLGALFAAALIAFSPTLLYFSRFARNDIYIAVFTLGIIVCLWRYAAPAVGEALGRNRYLYIAAALLGLSFAAKENTFLTASILLMFLNFWVASDFLRQSRERLNPGRLRVTVYALLYIPLAWAIAALWPFIRGVRERLGLQDRPPSADFLVVLGTLTGPQLAAAVQVPLDSLFGIELNTLADERAWGIPTVLVLLAASAVVGLAWNWRVWIIVAACFYVPYALLYTSFFTHPGGFGSGIWESLDYWLDQHGYRRGDQPDFYYLMLLPAYEFVALAFAGPALLYYSLRGGLRSIALTLLAAVTLLAFFGGDSFAPSLRDVRWLGGLIDDVPLIGDRLAGTRTESVLPALLPVAAVAVFFAVRGTMFERFLVFWAAASIVAYSWVGEKMPWLSVHTTLPVVILAAYTLGRLFEARDARRETRDNAARLWRRALPRAAPVIAAAAGALAVGLAAFAAGGALRTAGIAVALALLIALLPLAGRRRLAPLAAAAVLGALTLFSLRTAVMAVYDHGDVPRELLVYTQTSPEVPDIAARIDRAAELSGLGRDLPVQVDQTYTWPWAWYLRDYTRLSYVKVDDKFEPQPGAVLIIATPNQNRIEPYADRYEPPLRHYLRWWFPEDYRGIGDKDDLGQAIKDFVSSLGRERTWERWWRYFRDRDVTPQGVEELAYFPVEYARALPSGLPGDSVDVEGRLVSGGPGKASGEFNRPLGMAVDGQGNVYVADAGNSRIQKFDRSGQLVKAVGEAGKGRGQFNQPSDVALDAKGNVYVADTWNHRVQKFGPDLKFLAAWGQPTQDLLNPAPDRLWGPRALAVDAKGDVWVVDTGTHTVRRFRNDGKPLASFGGYGRGKGQFREPVGIAITREGSIFIADAGNARIQEFDAKFGFKAAYPIDAWQDLDPRSKPYLAALPDGRLLASDGPHGRLLLVNLDGEVASSLVAVQGIPLFFPASVAYDAAAGFVYVADPLANHVRRFPFTDFALR